MRGKRLLDPGPGFSDDDHGIHFAPLDESHGRCLARPKRPPHAVGAGDGAGGAVSPGTDGIEGGDPRPEWNFERRLPMGNRPHEMHDAPGLEADRIERVVCHEANAGGLFDREGDRATGGGEPGLQIRRWIAVQEHVLHKPSGLDGGIGIESDVPDMGRC